MINLSNELRQKIQSLNITKDIEKDVVNLKNFWQILQQSELALMELMANKLQTNNANVEYGPALYILNNEFGDIVSIPLRALGMPPSKIPTEDWAIWKKEVKDGPGAVANDGTIFLETTYASLDPKWFEALVDYIFFKAYKKGLATFKTSPINYTVTNQNKLSIAIVGDWGTGNYDDSGFPSPSELVGKAISALKPDITIHLGDVYYAGKSAEETSKLLNNFPEGKLASFTLNSNHEMYDGANGYFDTALTSPIFVKQQGTSYFAIIFNDWVIIGLDTVFYDTSSLFMDGSLTDSNQLNFIKSLGIKPSQKVIIMSHHIGISCDGTTINTNLFNQIHTALGRYPDYWYYGHLHNGIIYNDSSVTANYTCLSGAHPQMRCIGHGAIPFGTAKSLQNADGTTIKGVSYFANSPMPNPQNIPLLQLRVLNGFAIITLQAETISEQVIEVSANGSKVAWENM